MSLKKELKEARNQHFAGNITAALPVYRKVLQAHPNHVETLYLMGMASLQQGNPSQAIALLARAAALMPNHLDIRHNLANALLAVGQGESALPHYEAAWNRAEGVQDIALNYGLALVGAGELEQALAVYRKGLSKHPESGALLNELVKTLREACDWEELNTLTTALCSHKDENPCPIRPYHALCLPLSESDQQSIARRFAQSVEAFMAPAKEALNFQFSGRDSGKIKIGYVSADFRNHPTAHLCEPLFSLHDRERFEIYAYALVDNEQDPYRQRIAEASDYFISLQGLPHTEAAQRIHADGVDILVDMMGYIHNSRPQIFALKPAPIQISFLAYPGTMGADFMDYIITDHTALPETRQAFFDETPIFMPHSYFITNNRQNVGETPSRAEEGLPEEGFVFASFNKPNKIDPEAFSCWMKILKAVPESCLWLYAPNILTQKNLLKEARGAGVDSNRVLFASRKPKTEHLGRLKLADLCLDTFTVCAHTTAIDALWAGVPILSKQGHNLISGASASILEAAGLSEALLCPDAESYTTRAIQLATEPEDLAALREKLESPSALPIFDTEGYIRHLERSYLAAYERYQQGESPQSISV